MSGGVSAETIAEALGLTRQAVNVRAKEKNWPFSRATVRGGKTILYRVGTLPPDVKAKVIEYLASRDTALTAALNNGRAVARKGEIVSMLDARGAEAARQAGLAKWMELPEAGKRRAEAKAAIVDIARRYIQVAGLPKKRGQVLFCEAYGAGQIDVPAWVRAERPKVCANSLDNWENALSREGLSRLGGKYGKHRLGTGVIDANPLVRTLILGMLHDWPHLSAQVIMEAIRADIAPELHPSYRTLQRWLANWKEENRQVFAEITNPDAARSHQMPAGGDADALINRLNQRWETDSTKGDLILADGKRHVIVGIIDVWSRRLKLYVSPSSSAAAVAAAFRRALLDWGVPEELGTDNGSDYVSAQIKRALAGLDIKHHIAPPFQPQKKPFIERAFGTFTRGVAEMLPGFVGHSVGDRKGIEARRSFAQRLMKQGGPKLEIAMTAPELQKFCDEWCENIYGVQTHSGIKTSPMLKAASWQGWVRRVNSERALDVLLARAPGKDGTRTVTKKGIKHDNAWFDAPELGGLEKDEVQILLDEADIGRVFVFNAKGEFVCVAVCSERLGISHVELSSARHATRREVTKKGKVELREAAKAADTDNLLGRIMRKKAIDAGKMITFPQPTKDHTTTALEQAARAAAASDPAALRTHLSEEEAALAARGEAGFERLTAEIIAMPTPAATNSAPGARPRFRSDLEMVRWLLAHPDAVDAEDRGFLKELLDQPSFRLLAEAEGVILADVQRLVRDAA